MKYTLASAHVSSQRQGSGAQCFDSHSILKPGSIDVECSFLSSEDVSAEEESHCLTLLPCLYLSVHQSHVYRRLSVILLYAIN